MMNSLWIQDLTRYEPAREGHWPPYCAGFTLSKSGRIWLTDNKPITINQDGKQGVLAPCHRDLINGEGEDKTVFSGLYCYNPKHKRVSLWLYSFAEVELTERMMQGLKSLIGVHKITAATAVLSNTSRKELFTLQDI
jgi:hypothetical protein